jgi:release factor glutamine methyltransferase
MKVLSARKWAEGELKELESPELEADLLLCHIMNWKRHELYLNQLAELPVNSLESYREAVARRRNREPLQHITGSVEFLGRTFSADPAALIARPETEFLTEVFLNQLSHPSRILDVGTGSGVIAVSLALHFPDTLVIGTDISRSALELSSENREIFKVENLFFVECDLAGPFGGSRGGFDGIVANLPYIPTDTIPRLEPEVSEGDPLLALDGGTDGLELVRQLIDSAPEILISGGLFALELDCDQVDSVANSLRNSPLWAEVRVFNDPAGRPRVVTCRRTCRRNL